MFSTGDSFKKAATYTTHVSSLRTEDDDGAITISRQRDPYRCNAGWPRCPCDPTTAIIVNGDPQRSKREVLVILSAGGIDDAVNKLGR